MSAKRKTHIVKGEELTIEEACKKYNQKPSSIRNRMYSKEITLEEAIFFIPSGHFSNNKGNKEWQSLKSDSNSKMSPRIDIKDL